ncbi:Rv3235 family protein [Nocardioides zeae]|uniref:Rv3235 family protein n=1 Tax=Nocardioides imazamoxiresistens TaxID=3231893 RepID=A0ABU3Q1K2_9ACTN|nr:Rv3235 family protein [Nocardioides zeae]MDT9594912.1 Rv3235 family protein [Nocardioides zeae]
MRDLDPRATPPTPRGSTVTALRPRRPGVPVQPVLQGTLALDIAPLLDPPPAPVTPDPPGPTGPGADVEPVDLRHRRSLEQWAHRFCQAAVEIAGGDRPATQLGRWTSGSVLDDLARRAHLVGQASLRGGWGRTRSLVRPQVHSVHACFVSPAVAEVSAHVRYGRRSRAVAARFEMRTATRGRAGEVRWLCTALEFA